MEILIEAVGTKPLLLHNIDLGNPFSPWYQKMAKLRGTPSKNRTESWLEEMTRVQFLGAFYDIPEIKGIAIPAENFRRSIAQAGTITRNKAKLLKALAVMEPSVEIMFEGPKTPEELWNAGEKFRITRMIRGSTGSASPTTYPMFTEWAMRVPLQLDEKVLNFEIVRGIAEHAGRVEGVGASRKQGYGRYAALVKSL
jgi:hypothetical protein